MSVERQFSSNPARCGPERKNMETKLIYCCGCSRRVFARLTNGAEVYAHRKDLASLPFWRCDTCGNFVGCHHQTDTPTKPLGVIATPEIKQARMRLHATLDPLYREGLIRRAVLYKKMARALGVREFHTAEIRSMAQARRAFLAATSLAADLRGRPTAAMTPSIARRSA